jgi:uncharacterized membrane protein
MMLLAYKVKPRPSNFEEFYVYFGVFGNYLSTLFLLCALMFGEYLYRMLVFI